MALGNHPQGIMRVRLERGAFDLGCISIIELNSSRLPPSNFHRWNVASEFDDVILKKFALINRSPLPYSLPHFLIISLAHLDHIVVPRRVGNRRNSHFEIVIWQYSHSNVLRRSRCCKTCVLLAVVAHLQFRSRSEQRHWAVIHAS